MICPNCGKEADFREESGRFTETHGLDCGPYETWSESWLVCSECKAETTDKELREAQPSQVNQDIPLTRQAIVQLANISQLKRMAEEEDKQDITIPMGNPYPVVLADWTFHSDHYQAWNQKERMWIVIEKTPVNDAMGSEWELLWSL